MTDFAVSVVFNISWVVMLLCSIFGLFLNITTQKKGWPVYHITPLNYSLNPTETRKNRDSGNVKKRARSIAADSPKRYNRTVLVVFNTGMNRKKIERCRTGLKTSQNNEIWKFEIFSNNFKLTRICHNPFLFVANLLNIRKLYL